MNRATIAAFWAACFLLGFALSGCRSVQREFLEAEEATYSAIAPHYRLYVERDASLTHQERADRILTVESWAWSLVKQREALGEEDPRKPRTKIGGAR